MKVADDFGACCSTSEIDNRPSSKMNMNEGEPLTAEQAPEPKGAQGIAHSLGPVKSIRGRTCLLKRLDEGPSSSQEQGVDAISVRIQSLRERADNRGHARAFGLSGAKDVEYVLSHCSSDALLSLSATNCSLMDTVAPRTV